MVETIPSAVLAIINGGTRICAAVMLAALAALFLPAGLAETMGFTEFREAHRMELGLAVIASSSLLLIQLLITIGNLVTAPIRRRRKKSAGSLNP